MQVSRTSALPLQASAAAQRKADNPAQPPSKPSSAPSSPPGLAAEWKTARSEWQDLDRKTSTEAWLAARSAWKDMRDNSRAVPTPTDSASAPPTEATESGTVSTSTETGPLPAPDNGVAAEPSTTVEEAVIAGVASPSADPDISTIIDSLS